MESSAKEFCAPADLFHQIGDILEQKIIPRTDRRHIGAILTISGKGKMRPVRQI